MPAIEPYLQKKEFEKLKLISMKYGFEKPGKMVQGWIMERIRYEEKQGNIDIPTMLKATDEEKAEEARKRMEEQIRMNEEKEHRTLQEFCEYTGESTQLSREALKTWAELTNKTEQELIGIKADYLSKGGILKQISTNGVIEYRPKVYAPETTTTYEAVKITQKTGETPRMSKEDAENELKRRIQSGEINGGWVIDGGRDECDMTKKAAEDIRKRVIR